MPAPVAPLELVSLLLVGDDSGRVQALTEMLAEPGVRVVTASSAGEAQERIAEEDFAVVLLDLTAKGLDGLAAARQLRSGQTSHDLPIIFMSGGDVDGSALLRGFPGGAVAHLPKPLNADAVRAEVAVFTKLFRRGRGLQRRQQERHEAERQRDAEALRESEAQYEAIYNAAAVGIAHAGGDGRWLRANRRFSEIVGYSQEELLGRRLLDMTVEEERPQAAAVLRQVLTGGSQAYRAEHRFVHQSGRVVWVTLTVSALESATGAPKGFIACIQDITHRRQNEERQRFLAGASAALLGSLDFAAVLRTVAELAVPTIADACVIDLSRAEGIALEPIVAAANPEQQRDIAELHRLTERTPGLAEVFRSGTARLFADISLEAYEDRLTEPAIQALAHKVRPRSFVVAPMESRGRSLGAVVFFSLDSGRHFTSEDLAMAEDLGHRMALAVDNSRLYLAAQEAVSARDEFLSVASHELRTPLTPILLYFQRLLSSRGTETLETISPEKLRTTLIRAHGQVRRLATLVETLLDVSRIKSGMLDLHLESCDLAELAREVAARFTETAARSDSALLVDVEEGLYGQWDRVRMEQVLTNLIDNAIKYGRGHPIRVEVRGSGELGVFRIRDEGIGIAPEKLGRVFDRFERGVPTRSYGGLGLGLYIARQIVEAHGGTISVTSTVGQGAEFSVTLPLEAGLAVRSSKHSELRGFGGQATR